MDNINFTGIGGISLLSDIKQIEIFKGSQNSTYGPNAMGGIINIISKNSESEKRSIINMSGSSYNTYNLSTSFNLNINTKINSRITISKNYTNGMMNNLYTLEDDTNSKNERR